MFSFYKLFQSIIISSAITEGRDNAVLLMIFYIKERALKEIQNLYQCYVNM